MTRHLPTIAAAGALLLAGCGGGAAQRSADAAATARGDAGMLHFARCMRAHGVLMQDPSNRPGHAGLSIDLPEKSPASTTAYDACGHFRTMRSAGTCSRRASTTTAPGPDTPALASDETRGREPLGVLEPDGRRWTLSVRCTA